MSGINPIGSLQGIAQTAISKLQESQAENLRAKQAREVAQGFEEVLLNKVMEGMERTIMKSGLFEDQTGEQIRGMFWQFMSQAMTKQGGIGLANQVYQDIKRQVESKLPEVSMEQLK